MSDVDMLNNVAVAATQYADALVSYREAAAHLRNKQARFNAELATFNASNTDNAPQRTREVIGMAGGAFGEWHERRDGMFVFRWPAGRWDDASVDAPCTRAELLEEPRGREVLPGRVSEYDD